MEQLARFLGVSCDKAQLESLVESCNQLIEQCSNSEALSVCRGEWIEGREETCRKQSVRVDSEISQTRQQTLETLWS